MGVYKTHVVTEPETLQDIATQQLGDTSRWGELIGLNDLVYPYIVATNKEKAQNVEHLVTWGDTIKLPIENNVVDMDLDSYSAAEAASIYDTTMGMDLNLALDVEASATGARSGLLYLIPDKSRKDISTTAGVENLRQSLEMRLLTRYGTLAYHPNYGSHLYDMLGERLNDDTLARIKIEILRTIQTDKRVKKAEITDALISKGSNVYASISVTPNDLDTEFNLYIDLANTGSIKFQ